MNVSNSLHGLKTCINKTRKHLEEYLGEFLYDPGVGEDVLNQLEKENIVKGNSNKIGFVKVLNVCNDNRHCKNNC